jgi:hypothetical protein
VLVSAASAAVANRQIAIVAFIVAPPWMPVGFNKEKNEQFLKDRFSS